MYWNSRTLSSSDSLLCLSDGIMWNCILGYSGTSGSLFSSKNSGEQQKESFIRVRVGQKNPSLGIAVYHHWESLVMPNGDPQDGFYYPTHTLMQSFNILASLCSWAGWYKLYLVWNPEDIFSCRGPFALGIEDWGHIVFGPRKCMYMNVCVCVCNKL